MPQLVRGGGSEGASLSGVDRIMSFVLDPATLRGGTTFSETLVPSSFQRLGLVARAFQRIRWLKLRFRVEPQVSTATSGGYVAAFIKDPADRIGDIQQLTSTQGSVTTKWWQSSIIDATPPDRLFYTSEGAELREYSPGKIVVMVDGEPTQKGNVTVFAEWTVHLSGPGLETPDQVEEVFTALHPWYVRVGHEGLWGRKNGPGADDGGTWTSSPVELITPPPKIGDFFAVRPPFYLAIGEAGAQTMRQANWVYVYDAKTLFPVLTSKTDIAKDVFKEYNLVSMPGNRLDYDPVIQVSGEEQAPSSSVLQTTMADTELSTLAARFLELLMQSRGAETFEMIS